MANKQGKMVSFLTQPSLELMWLTFVPVLAKSREAFEVSPVNSVYFLTSGIDQLPYENNLD